VVHKVQVVPVVRVRVLLDLLEHLVKVVMEVLVLTLLAQAAAVVYMAAVAEEVPIVPSITEMLAELVGHRITIQSF